MFSEVIQTGLPRLCNRPILSDKAANIHEQIVRYSLRFHVCRGKMMIGPELAPTLMTAGRILLGFLFVAGGIIHIIMFAAIAGDMKKMGVHFPRLTLAAGTTFQITAGALLMFGLFVVPAALGLTIFT
ncbi:MAG: DoxX family membrane protein, partial [Rhizobiales bacterium]|nr:DoxX family membrane protein [Hyphomicrobiales bacterium]